MANRRLAAVDTIPVGTVVLSGRFQPSAALAPVVPGPAVGNTWFTAVRDNVGLFTVTLDNPFFAIMGGNAHLQLTAAPGGAGNAAFAQLGDIDVVTARTVVIRLLDVAGVVQDVALNANNWVHFTLFVRNKTSRG